MCRVHIKLVGKGQSRRTPQCGWGTCLWFSKHSMRAPHVWSQATMAPQSKLPICIVSPASIAVIRVPSKQLASVCCGDAQDSWVQAENVKLLKENKNLYTTIIFKKYSTHARPPLAPAATYPVNHTGIFRTDLLTTMKDRKVLRVVPSFHTSRCSSLAGPRVRRPIDKDRMPMPWVA